MLLYLRWGTAQVNYSSAGHGGKVKSLLIISAASSNLGSLQLRSNMKTDITLNQVVKIVDSRNMWSVARVTKVFPEADVASGLQKYT